MKRLSVLIAGGLLASGLGVPGVASAASDNGDTSFPLPDGTALEVHVTANCVSAEKQCYFTVAANRLSGDGVDGFPGDLWARQTTTLRSSNRLNNLETQVVAANTRQYKQIGRREITTIYFGGGPAEKYQISGQTQPTNWQDGQPMLNADYIVCAEIQVVYSGVNVTSPTTCAQTTFS
ncbi:hypothetical protein [Mycobacterium sp.]|jgi:hypothetical protein|uniref:hypothetical protein n=1 Tax=Mycobacterium sp. TaxID=1785 RepID=UPI002F0140F0